MSTNLLGPAGVQLNNQNMFCSVGRVGTGAEETIAHGLGVTPFLIQATCRDNTNAVANLSTTADATNIYITATNTYVYDVIAYVGRT